MMTQESGKKINHFKYKSLSEEVIRTIEVKKENLQKLKYSKSNIQVALDLCLDIKNEVKKLEVSDDLEINRFNRNWKLSIDKFGHLTLDDEEFDDTPAYWDDAVKEMIFDIDSLLRYLKKK